MMRSKRAHVPYISYGIYAPLLLINIIMMRLITIAHCFQFKNHIVNKSRNIFVWGT